MRAEGCWRHSYDGKHWDGVYATPEAAAESCFLHWSYPKAAYVSWIDDTDKWQTLKPWDIRTLTASSVTGS